MRAEPDLSPEPEGRWGQSRWGLQVASGVLYTEFTLDVSEPSAYSPLWALIGGVGVNWWGCKWFVLDIPFWRSVCAKLSSTA